jgi:hypothetical protein
MKAITSERMAMACEMNPNDNAVKIVDRSAVRENE